MNIALIEDHYLLAEALAGLLQQYDFIKGIRIYDSPKAFLEEAAAAPPDIIIADILIPGMSGIDLLMHFKREKINLKIIFLTAIAEVQTIRHAMRNGAAGYLAKDTTPDELADALLSVYHGECYIGESLKKSLIRNTFIENRFVYNLSPREKQVLQLVCSGKTIKEAAIEMNLSINTVQTYFKTILQKFNLNRTADLIVFAIQNGLYNPQAIKM